MSRQFLYLASAEAQLTLGFGAARPAESLFFALRPPAAVAQAARTAADALAAQHPGARLVSPARLHVTLHYLGQFAGLPPSLLARAQRAAHSLRIAPFALAFDRVASFGGQRRDLPAVALGGGDGTAGVLALHRALAAALVAEKLPADPRFTPHITLFYGRDAVPDQPLPVPLAWQADALWLLRSVRGEPRYREEGCWPLHA